MRSTLVNKEEKAREIEYPCLKIYNNQSNLGKYVVLFTKPNKGIVVFSENSRLNVGDNEKANNGCEWAEESFNHFGGTIELTNN